MVRLPRDLYARKRLGADTDFVRDGLGVAPVGVRVGRPLRDVDDLLDLRNPRWMRLVRSFEPLRHGQRRAHRPGVGNVYVSLGAEHSGVYGRSA